MSSSTCPHCGGGDIERDDTRGDSVCTRCGVVLEENAIVNDVQFAEAGGGSHTIIGQFVHADSSAKLTIGSLRSGKSSREVTLSHGRRKIEEVASLLRLSSSISDTAFNFLKMAVSMGITKGRRSTNVVAACLYMTCRIEQSPYLLLDFSDVLQVNVYELGKTMDFLAQKLHIRMPITDPCYYVSRFAHRLHFGDKTEDVAKIAMRLIQRMKRDWLTEGRRPAGVCGAALIVAARFYNFNRTIKDVVRVVHVGDQAVKKRLLEFASTPSGNLTVDEFVNLQVDLETEEDPPAFKDAKRKAMERSIENENRIVDVLVPQLSSAERELEQALAQKTIKKRGSSRLGDVASPIALMSPPPSPLRRVSSSVVPLSQDSLTGIDDPTCEEFVSEEIMQEVMSPRTPSPPGATPSLDSPGERARRFGPTLESLGIRRPPQTASTSAAPAEVQRDDDELDLEGIDDLEIDAYILSEPEVRMKTRIWMSINGVAMQDIEARRQQREEDELRDRNDPSKRKKKIKRKREPVHAATAAEAMDKVVAEKRLSAKINYDALKRLTAAGASPLAGASSPLTGASAPLDSSPSTSQQRKPNAMTPSDAFKNALTRKAFSRPTLTKHQPSATTLSTSTTPKVEPKPEHTDSQQNGVVKPQHQRESGADAVTLTGSSNEVTSKEKSTPSVDASTLSTGEEVKATAATSGVRKRRFARPTINLSAATTKRPKKS